MNIKDDLDYVKKELSADEKMIESALKVETLYKKYKILIWGVVGISVIGFGTKVVTDEITSQKLNSANSALITLQTKPNDKNAQNILKENNRQLFDLYSYNKAIKDKDTKELDRLSSNKNEILSDISKYHSAIISSKTINSKYYKNFSLLESAYSDIENKKIKEAKSKLEMIENRSSLASIAGLLNHYTIRGE
jgi:hypothetical protein